MADNQQWPQYPDALSNPMSSNLIDYCIRHAKVNFISSWIRILLQAGPFGSIGGLAWTSRKLRLRHIRTGFFDAGAYETGEVCRCGASLKQESTMKSPQAPAVARVPDLVTTLRRMDCVHPPMGRCYRFWIN